MGGTAAGVDGTKIGGTLFFGTVSGGFGAVLTNGNFWQCAATGLIVSGLNHVAHRIYISIENGKVVIAGIYGAGSKDNTGNTDLRNIVERKGGKMFTSSWGGGDDEIINYLLEGYNSGKLIEIYGYSRGGNAAIRFTNKLGDMGVNVSKLFTFDPHSLTSGASWRQNYSFELRHNNIGMAVNFYQQNQEYMFKPGNPFWGNKVHSNYINVVNHQFTDSSVNHINIIRHSLNTYHYGF
ncbi:MAG: hypothetical protein J6581_08385 [Apibacter sp.]|nr:hypothetical protein [Apibacter sp.]